MTDSERSHKRTCYEKLLFELERVMIDIIDRI